MTLLLLLTDMNLPQSPLKSFTSRLGQLLSQRGSAKAPRSGQQEPLIRRQNNGVETQPRLIDAVHSPSSVQIALMQRMGVKGRPFMEACKRRSISI
jgi:hypothetical protein